MPYNIKKLTHESDSNPRVLTTRYFKQIRELIDGCAELWFSKGSCEEVSPAQEKLSAEFLPGEPRRPVPCRMQSNSINLSKMTTTASLRFCLCQSKDCRQDAATVFFFTEDKILLSLMQGTNNCLETFQIGTFGRRIQCKSDWWFFSATSHCHWKLLVTMKSSSRCCIALNPQSYNATTCTFNILTPLT